MADVHKDNTLRQIESAKKQARLAHAAHEFFTKTEGGKELLRELQYQSGANCAAFSAKDNFNPHGAAFRDGMRATYLIIETYISQHTEQP